MPRILTPPNWRLIRRRLPCAIIPRKLRLVLGEARLQQRLGLETRFEAHDFLKAHGAPMHDTLEDLEADCQTHDRLGVSCLLSPICLLSWPSCKPPHVWRHRALWRPCWPVMLSAKTNLDKNRLTFYSPSGTRKRDDPGHGLAHRVGDR